MEVLTSLAVATVLGNWHNVLRAISMASSKSSASAIANYPTNSLTVKLPKPKDSEDPEAEDPQRKPDAENPLPQTLVRIPTEHAPMLEQATSGGNGE